MHVCIRSFPQTIPPVKRVGGFISLVGEGKYGVQNIKFIKI